MLDRPIDGLAEELAEPADALALDDVIGIEDPLYAGDGGNVTADDDDRLRGVLPHQSAHLAHLADIDDDPGNPDEIVAVGLQLPDEAPAGGKVEQRRGYGEVLLDQHETPGAVMHAQRERSLRTRDLVVIKLERVDGAASELIVTCEGAKHRREEHATDTLRLRHTRTFARKGPKNH